jgi:drug/metabolite transporter (DMT)-like permease
LSPTTLFLIASAVWGSTWLAIKFQLGVVAPEWSVAYRFALAAIVLALWCAASGRSLRFTTRDHLWLALLGATLFGFNYIGVYLAEQYVTSGLVAVIFALIVFMNPIGMRLAFGTTLSARMLIAGAVGVIGVALLFLPEIEQASRGGAVAWGIVLALVSTAIASGGNIVAMRNNAAGLPVLPATAWGMAYGAAIAALSAALQGIPPRFDAGMPYLLSLAYLAVFGSVVAFGAYLTLLKRVGGGPAAFTGVAIPVIAMLLSTLFEGYRWTAVAALGVVLAVAGNVIALLPGRRAKAA